MVTIITGGENSSREKMFSDRIKSMAEKGNSVLVIVPDQFSFEYEKKLYGIMGAQLFNKISTAGFNRLSEKIAEQYGGFSRENANDNAKIILMYRAVRRLSRSGEVKFYKKNLDKGSFISELIKLVGQFRESGVTCNDLQLAAERLEGSVSLKLFDLSRIYRYYLEELDKAKMRDTLSAMAEAVKLAGDNGFFKGKSVFVTAFNSFTFDERKMLDLCVAHGDNLIVSLLVDEECTSKYSSHPFAVTVKTAQQIRNMAQDHNKSLEQLTAEETEYRSFDIMHLSKNLYNFNKTEYKAKSNDVQIYSADDMYEEAEFICAEICRLVREEGFRYNDIAVSARDLSLCSMVLEGAFEKYEIPYYLDIRDSISSSAIVHYINAVFKTVLTKKFRTENIMKLIKSPLFGILNYDASELEEYCQVWNVDGDMWLSPFTAANNTYAAEKINKLREQIIDPLVKFKTNCADATAKQICEAFYALLIDIKLSEQTYSLVKRASASDNETQLEFSRNLRQIWNMTLSAVKSVYECLGDEKISLRQFYELFRLMLSQMQTSNPPQKLDCVRITEAGRSRADNVKVMFAAEVNDGIFPAPVKQGGIVTEREKELLSRSQNIDIESGAMNDFKNEKLIVYSTLSAPTDKLYITYSRADLLGNEKRPSAVVKEVKQITGVDEKLVSSVPADFFCTTYKTAYNKFIEMSRKDGAVVSAIRESVRGSAFYDNKLSNIFSANGKSEFSMSGTMAEKVFFKGDITEVSPTKLDTYFKCPFMYFCSYGLKLKKPVKAEINPLSTGNIIHSLLEKILRGKDGERFNKEFPDMSDGEIKEFIDKAFNEYYEKEMGGDFGKTKTFAYLFGQLKEKAFFIVKFVKAELKGSNFEPVLLEHKIEHKEDHDCFTITLDDGRKIVLAGTIDRADIMTDKKGKRYVRIVDYKTGKMKFSLSKLYNGLNLQMLVYLSTLLETKNELTENDILNQAGVVYFTFGTSPGKKEDVEDSYETLYAAACEERISGYDKSGEYIKNKDVKNSMKSMVRKYAKGQTEVEDESFTAMRTFANQKVKEYGDKLLNGGIPAKPVKDACSYCDFQGICGRAFPDDCVDTDDKKYAELMEDEINKIIKLSKKTEEGDDGK